MGAMKSAFSKKLQNIWRSRSKENIWNISFFLFVFRLLLFVLDSFSSSANTRASVRTWWWCQSCCSWILPMYSIYYRNLISFPLYSPTLLLYRSLCICVHFSALTSLHFLFFFCCFLFSAFAWQDSFECRYAN
jgi:hypothetical protein